MYSTWPTTLLANTSLLYQAIDVIIKRTPIYNSKCIMEIQSIMMCLLRRVFSNQTLNFGNLEHEEHDYCNEFCVGFAKNRNHSFCDNIEIFDKLSGITMPIKYGHNENIIHIDLK